MEPMLLEASTNMFSGITSASFMGVLDQVIALVPVVFPAVVGFIAFRKGWTFIRTAIKGA